MSLKKAADVLKIYSSFVISTHINPEGDSLGSQLALFQLLERMGKKAVMINDHKVPSVYGFLPKSELIRTRLDKKTEYDVFIAIDCPNMDRTGRVREIVKNEKITLNIDHHISNEKFGKVNWVDPKAGSCGEMVYALYKELGHKIDLETAINLYTAISTDTGSFRYSNTTSNTHRIAAELIECGLDVTSIQQSIYEKKKINDLKLLGLALSDVQIDEGGKIAYLTVTKDMARQCGIDIKRTEEFVNFPRSVDSVAVAMFFREEDDGNIHVSFRSKSEIDVNKIAASLGGGGHAKAAGCLIKGGMDDVKSRVLAEVRKELGDK